MGINMFLSHQRPGGPDNPGPATRSTKNSIGSPLEALVCGPSSIEERN